MVPSARFIYNTLSFNTLEKDSAKDQALFRGPSALLTADTPWKAVGGRMSVTAAIFPGQIRPQKGRKTGTKPSVEPVRPQKGRKTGTESSAEPLCPRKEQKTGTECPVEQVGERKRQRDSGRAAWRMTDEEDGADEGTIGEAVAARVSDERKRGVSGAVHSTAGFPSSETGRDTCCPATIREQKRPPARTEYHGK